MPHPLLIQIVLSSCLPIPGQAVAPPMLSDHGSSADPYSLNHAVFTELDLGECNLTITSTTCLRMAVAGTPGDRLGLVRLCCVGMFTSPLDPADSGFHHHPAHLSMTRTSCPHSCVTATCPLQMKLYLNANFTSTTLCTPLHPSSHSAAAPSLQA